MSSMTSRERVQKVLHGKQPDRVPFNFWMDRDAMAAYDEKWGTDFRLTHYGADVVEAFVVLDWWPGFERKMQHDSKTSWQVEPMVDSLEKALDIPMPDPTDTDVYKDIKAKRSMYPDKAILAMLTTPLDILQPLRMAENLFTDLYDHPEIIHELLGKAKPVLTEAARRACELDIDVLYMAGDICGRNGALISPKSLREFHFDYVKDAVNAAHDAGKKVFYHSDGYVLDIVDIYVEYGIDGCNPVEPRYNDANEFVKRSGGKLILYGGLDNCSAIPDGTPETVKAHVRNQFDALGKDGRLIFSSHDIPSHCPEENLDAMVEEINACKYPIG